ncbi:MAG: carboxypeptidase regulatory-like domain-containing protein [Bryobacterales bacterium]|nr:carboxypeptidase regulatory-like domain-containing protein [Bryobacterales bacterium]
MNKRMWLSLVLLTALVWHATAQDYRARVQGIVTDASSAVIPGARVTLLNTNTGVETVRESGANGQYLFDFVEPGTYQVSVESEGFGRFVQQNIVVQVRADVTVNPVLRVGVVAETITVAESAVEIQFNTSTMSLTVDRKMLTDLPVLARNPFTLALLDPAVVNRYTSNLATRNPFYMWSSSSMDVGGNTSRKNDLLLDGAPLQLNMKGSYAPPMDAVQEFTVQQNAVDAEFGHSAGGVMSLSMKSGTNEYHGTGYYMGRNPALNAVTNSVARAPNLVRNHIWGGTLGNPIVKNKLFTFTSYEGWRQNDPRQAIITLPTQLERGGDFSQSLNNVGGLRTIYDPSTTQFNPATNTASRTPFAGNVIPQSRIDPVSRRFMDDIWLPNNPGTGPAGVQNFIQAYSWQLKYWNFSNRTDWNINDKWKVFGRYARFRTDIDQDNYTPNNSPAMRNDNGGVMNSRNVAGDAVYTMNPTTVINFRFSYASLNDDYDAPSAKIGEEGLRQFWPNQWYQSYLEGIPAIYYPQLAFSGRGSATFGRGGYWWQHPESYNYSGRVSKNIGAHYVKWGGESRLFRGSSIRPNLMDFAFGPNQTANTFLNPNTNLSGDMYATFLVGAIGSNSRAQAIPLQKVWSDFYAFFIQDDWKLNRNITLNLGLRWEYQTGPWDPDDRMSRFLDLSNPIPEMQAAPPQLPAEALALRNAPPVFNGAWVFTDSNNRQAWNGQRNLFLPRAGLAIRLNDKSALRFGYARYAVPPLLNVDGLGSFQYPGFSALTTALPELQGVPQALLSDPFPANSNPLIPPVGKSLGRYTNLGQAASWNQQDFRTGINDRFNVSYQVELPGRFNVDATYFFNLGRNLPMSNPGTLSGNVNQGLQLNMVDPNIVYAVGGPVDRQVDNPFFNYLTPELFQGQLRNQRRITVRNLLRPFPQYGDLTQTNTSAFENRYQAFQLKVQRPVAQGLMIHLAYNYNYERNSNFFNDIDQFANRWTWLDSNNPRHRIAYATTYDLPFGRGRRFLADSNRVVDAILGGWQASGMLFWDSGAFLRFGTMQYLGGDPRISDRSRDRWFDTSQFAVQPAYIPRSNPYQFGGVRGPYNWSLDNTLAKVFTVTERVRFEMRLEAYNLTNSFVPTNPITSVTNANFGRSVSQMNRGREFQYTGRIMF